MSGSVFGRALWQKPPPERRLGAGHCYAVSLSLLAQDRARLQLFQQRLGVLQIAGVEAFGEPGVEWGKEVARGSAFALVAPQAREAGRLAQLEGLRFMSARDFDLVVEEILRLLPLSHPP